MGQLNNLYVSSSFQGLLKLTNSTQGLTNTLQTVQGGDGSNSPLQMSLTDVNISGSFFINNVPITNGTNGTSGTSGAAGSSGSSGTSGASGSSGSTGSGGTSGTSGTSGDSLFALTGSVWNTTNNVGITGSLDVSGSNTIIGNTVMTGSLFVSGGQVTVGNPIDNDYINNGANPSVSLQYNDYSSFFSVTNPNYSQANFIVADSGYTYDNEFNIIVSSGSIKFNEYNQNRDYNYRDWLQVQASTSGATGIKPIQLLRNTEITGSLNVSGNTTLDNTILSGSLIGNTVNGGLIKIQSEANRSGSVQFNITGSNPISQSNFIFGNPTGPAGITQTGSVVISGSNNIILNGFRTDSSPFGIYGYIGGNGNIGNIIPTLGTGSLLRPSINQNALQAGLTLQFTTSSLGSQPSFQANLIYGGVTINHQSGSVTFNTNNTLGGSVTSNQNITTANTTAFITNNIFTGNLTTNLNHNSSSINYQGNIGPCVINNNYSSSVSTAVDNINVNQNLFNGNTEIITVSGSNSATRRTFNSNLISGRSNLVNSNYSGSFTGGHLIATTILGQELIVSASHTSTTVGGSTFVGRYNATGSLQESSQDAIFVVGTGTSAANRRNALHIDSSNNTRITGSVSISGSLTLNGSSVVTGSVSISGSLTLNGSSVVTGSVVTDRNGLITTGSATTYPTQTIQGGLQIVSGSLWAKGRNSGNNLAYGEFALASITTAGSNTGLGNSALQSATTGGGNLAVGGAALSNMTTGQNNVGIGNQALLNNISGSNNTAIGANTLQNNVAGFNLAIGTDALKFNTTGQYNNAIGDASLFNNTTGDNNLAIGKNSLFFNTTGGSNVGIGGSALTTNVSGSNNVAVGNSALQNSVSSFNVAIGAPALSANTTGQYNVAIGQSSFQANTIGGKNTTIGWNSGVNNLTGSTNTIIGAQALENNVNGSGNVAIGYAAGFNSTGSNGFYVGNENYGSLNNEQNKSLMYGEFNNTTANQTLQINATTTIKTGNLIAANNLVVTGSIDIIGNFPGDPGKTFVIRSGSMKMGDFNNSVRIADLNNQPQLFFNGTRKVGFFLGQSNMDQVDTQFGIVSGSENIYTMGGNFNNFRSGSNNLMLGVQNISIKSGSNNIILAKEASYTTGSNNLILGSLQGVDEAQDYFNLQLPQSNDPIMFKSGSAPLTISGSLKVTDGANITGSLIVSGSAQVTGSVNISGSLTVNGSPVGSKDYGSFQYSTNQNAPSAGTADVLFDTTIISSGITLSGTTDFVVTKDGKYKIDFDCSPSGNIGRTLYFWVAVNGVDVSYTARKINTGYGLTNTSMSWIISCNANDAIKVVMNCSNNLVVLSSFTAPGGITGGTTVNITEI